MPPALVVEDLGPAAYEPTLRLQMERLEEVRTRTDGRGYLLLVEHDPPVITRGAGASDAHILATPGQLRAEGVQLHTVRRGGDVTYHGPGQLVAYPILRIDRRGKDIHAYLRDLEEAIIRTLARVGIEGRRQEGFTGVWVPTEPPAKIAAIGVGVRRWVSYHGLALNVQPIMRHFGLIVPCGLAGKPVTSVAEQLGRDVSVSRMKPLLVQSLADVLGMETQPPTPGQP
ncbi:MAG: lipoyl(octanoyl) transferase LipB [Phycisphaerae bacterium]